MKKEFNENLEKRVLPGLKRCEDVRNKHAILRKRNAESIKAWINNFLRKKTVGIYLT